MEKLTDNKKVVNKFFENFEKGNYAEVEKLLAGNFKLNITGFDQPIGKEEALHLIEGYRAAFPDIKFNTQVQLQDGDYVITRLNVTGTHKGEFQGIAPTNKKVTSGCTAIQKVVNGKLTEEFTEVNLLSLLQQINAIPTFKTDTRIKEAHLN